MANQQQQPRYAKFVNGTPRYAGDAILFNQPSRQGLHIIPRKASRDRYSGIFSQVRLNTHVRRRIFPIFQPALKNR